MGARLPKANTNFGKITDSFLIAYSQNIKNKMLASGNFPTPPQPYVDLQLLIDDFAAKSAAAIKGSKADTAAKDISKAYLVNTLRAFGAYVNQEIYATHATSNPDLNTYDALKVLILSSGFDLQKDPNPGANVVGMQLPKIIQLISTETGKLHVLLRQYKKSKRVKTLYDVQLRTSAVGVTPAGPWIGYTFTSGNFDIESLDSGKSYDFMVAAVNGRNTRLNQVNPLNYTPIQKVIIT